MRKRERIDSLPSLLIFLTACALFVIYVSGCTSEPGQKQRQQWIGEWILEPGYVIHHNFEHDGTWNSYRPDDNFEHDDPNDAVLDPIPISDGTYSVAGDRFRITRLDIYGNMWFSGTWERIADKLVLYVDPPPAHPLDSYQYPMLLYIHLPPAHPPYYYRYSQEALIYTKVRDKTFDVEAMLKRRRQRKAAEIELETKQGD